VSELIQGLDKWMLFKSIIGHNTERWKKYAIDTFAGE